MGLRPANGRRQDMARVAPDVKEQSHDRMAVPSRFREYISIMPRSLAVLAKLACFHVSDPGGQRLCTGRPVLQFVAVAAIDLLGRKDKW